MKLRPYQTEAVDSLYQYFGSHTGNPIIALPTGTGKSVVIAEFCRHVFEAFVGQRIVVATHVMELIQQNHEKLLAHWPTAPAGIFSASVGRRDIAPITFVGIQTVAKRAAEFGHIDLLIIDECHLVGSSQNAQYLTFIAALAAINPKIKIIGLTATAYRLGMGMLTEGGIFTDIAFDLTDRLSFNRLIAQGYICPLIARKTQTELDVSNVHKQGGEYIQKELQDAVDKSPVTSAALKEACVQGEGRKHWLVFAAGLKHAANICEMLNLMGVPSAVVSGELPKPERERILRQFKDGTYQAVVNNNVLTTGFDFPGIDLIVMLRPTSSPGLWVQMLGRGTRPSPNKMNCLVLDFAGNTRRLGPINDPIIPKKKGAGGGGTAPVRLCPVCNTYNHASARECECCGELFPTVIKIDNTASLAPVIADDLPVIADFPVTDIQYSRHTKIGKPPSLRVSYICGLRRFEQWVCLEHPGYAGYKAGVWWHEMGKTPAPTSIDEALSRVGELRRPASIKVWVNTKHPEIMGTSNE
jgi:DNA repair protein RadD